ncbi:MAG: phosphohistidine phosphatase SixA [Gemmatimonadaceae bacterium]
MRLLVVRHGDAEERAPGGDDSSRALTKKGEQEMKVASAGLRTLVEAIAVIGASPLVRAQQTAKIVAKAYGDLRVETVEALSPGGAPSALVAWAAQYDSAETVAVVGHQPDLGTLVTWLMTKAGNSRVELKKGGAALLEFSTRLAAGSGTLLWLLTGSQLRRIGK